MYLHCFTSSNPKEWLKWLTWVEYCYNTSFHSTIQRTPFEVVYGILHPPPPPPPPPPQLLNYVPGTAKLEAVERELLSCDQVLKEVRHCITKAQACMKRIYDLKHREREFQVGDFVYLKLQPYCL